MADERDRALETGELDNGHGPLGTKPEDQLDLEDEVLEEKKKADRKALGEEQPLGRV